MRLGRCRSETSFRYPAWVRRSALLFLILLSFFNGGCSDPSKTPGNSNAVSNQKPAANSNANAGQAVGTTIDFKEPERYVLQMSMSVQETASETPAPMLTQQLSLARFDADRRWAFVLPSLPGQVVYLEKSGLKYLVASDRKQYVELASDALGFQPREVFIPNAIAERVKTRPSEKLGLEPVNGRTAVKYRVTSSNDGSSHPNMIFVDQETGLLLRSELNSDLQSQKKVRMIVEVRDLQLNPDRAQFDVPAGMKKVTQQEARQLVEGVANALRPFANVISGKDFTPVATAEAVGKSNANRGVR